MVGRIPLDLTSRRFLLQRTKIVGLIGIVVLLVISWLLLHFFIPGANSQKFFLPTPRRLGQFTAGALVTAALCLGVQHLEATLAGAEWVRNSDITPGAVAERAWWDFRSVLTEELLFRGALLYLLLRKTRPWTACLISGLVFGVYHWFSFGLFGQPVAMIVILLGTGMMGVALALAVARTGSIWLATGLHFGWNFVLNTLFSRGPLGNGLFVPEGGSALSSWVSLIGLWVVPLLVLAFVSLIYPASREASIGRWRTS